MASRGRQNDHVLEKGAGLSSRVSLLSAFTSSSGSSGSTVTPDSMSRVQTKKKPITSKARSSKQMPQSRRKREVEKVRKEPRSPIDVFQFLDPSRNSTRTSLAGNKPPTSEVTMSENLRSESCARSLHSDSGISIRDSSPESLNRRQSDLEMVEEGKPLAYDLKRRNLTGKAQKRAPADSSDESEDPELFYLGPEKQRSASLVNVPKKRSVDTRGLSGYDLLAHQLSHGEIQPMYRKFDWLQQRNLLQLQDELAEMEEELKRLDHEDARFRSAQRSNHGQHIPASRRVDCQWQNTVELCGRRVEILAIIQVKLKEYSMYLSLALIVSNILQTKCFNRIGVCLCNYRWHIRKMLKSIIHG